jgi:hypothetical protein
VAREGQEHWIVYKPVGWLPGTSDGPEVVRVDVPPRLVADTVFDRAMKDMGVGTVTRNMIYRAVRARGGGYWDDNSRAKAAGERRVLAKFPDSPTITWEEWRQRPDVFAPGQ